MQWTKKKKRYHAIWKKKLDTPKLSQRKVSDKTAHFSLCDDDHDQDDYSDEATTTSTTATTERVWKVLQNFTTGLAQPFKVSSALLIWINRLLFCVQSNSLYGIISVATNKPELVFCCRCRCLRRHILFCVELCQTNIHTAHFMTLK